MTHYYINIIVETLHLLDLATVEDVPDEISVSVLATSHGGPLLPDCATNWFPLPDEPLFPVLLLNSTRDGYVPYSYSTRLDIWVCPCFLLDSYGFVLSY